MKIEVSNGELFDKWTILKIKLSNITDPIKLKNVRKECSIIESTCNSISQPESVKKLIRNLEIINRKLWNVEDELRAKEKLKEFDLEFVELARSVYKLNDKRSSVKHKINLLTGSSIIEEKSYS